MGIYDREYYRDERSGFFHALTRQGSVTRTLIVINIVFFIIQLATKTRFDVGPFTEGLWLDSNKVLSGQIWRLVTWAFLHDVNTWEHIVFNMLILWWAGSEIEEIYGSKEYLILYLMAAIVSALAFVVYQVFTSPADARAPALGASGAVMAVFTLFALHYPRRTVYLFFVIPVPVFVCLILYVLQDSFGLLGASGGRQIAFAAHLGGAAFGFLYFRTHMRLSQWWPGKLEFRLPRRKPQLKVFRGEEAEAAPPARPAAPDNESRLEEELDHVLAKVAQFGKSSLSPHEQQILLRASEIYRQRRK